MDYSSLNFIWNTICFWAILFIKFFIALTGVFVITGFQLEKAKKIFDAKSNNKMAQDINIIKENLMEISKVICLNLFILFVMYKFYIYFESEVFKLAFSLYICLILGFAASFPLVGQRNFLTKHDEGIITARNIANTTIFYSSFLFYHYDVKGIILSYI
jgi:hypothetical protein